MTDGMTVWLLLFITLKPNNTLEREYFDAAFFTKQSCEAQGRLNTEVLKLSDSFRCAPVQIKEDLLIDVSRELVGL